MDEVNLKISVELNDKQDKKYRQWLSHIKALYGDYGTMTWKIKPTGIGDEIIVYSHNARVELDLTDVNSW